MRTAEEWGRVAVSLPGWRWMPGMRDVHPQGGRYSCRSILSDDWWTTHAPPDPDDPATAGCLLVMLGNRMAQWIYVDQEKYRFSVQCGTQAHIRRLVPLDGAQSLGRACIAAAEALGRWPGGAE